MIHVVLYEPEIPAEYGEYHAYMHGIVTVICI